MRVASPRSGSPASRTGRLLVPADDGPGNSTADHQFPGLPGQLELGGGQHTRALSGRWVDVLRQRGACAAVEGPWRGRACEWGGTC